MTAQYVPQVSVAVQYASLVGCVADGATDNTATIQAVLDAYGSAAAPLEFVFDQPGTTLIAGTVYCWSNQTLRGIAGAGLKKAGYPATNGWALFSNKHPAVTGTTPTDQYITLRDLAIDGNKLGGANGVSGGGSTPFESPAGYVVPTLGFYGVSFLRLDNVHIVNSPSYGFHLANVQHGLVLGCSKFNTTDNFGGDDCYHLNGGCLDVHCIGFGGSANDDNWSICGNDGNDLVSPTITFKPGTVAQGPIVHCSIRDSVFSLPTSSSPLGNAGRFLSSNPASYIEDFVIDNVTMPCNNRGIRMDNFGVALGNGLYRAITIANCTFYLTPLASGTPTYAGIIDIGFNGNGATVDNINIHDVVMKPSGGALSFPALIRVAAGGTVTAMKIHDAYLADPNGYVSTAPIILAGTATTADVAGLVISRGTQSTLAQPAISCTGTVGRLRANGGHVDRMSNVVNVSAGTTTDVGAAGYSHTNANGGASFAQSSTGTFSRLRAACSDTALLSSGTIASNKNDGTQDS